MKKEITTVFMTLATALGFAQDAELVNPIQLEVKPVLPAIETKIETKVVPNRSFGYLCMGVSDSELPKDTVQMLPGLRLGYRIVSGASALDISASFNRRDFHSDEGKNRTYQYTLPRANYLYYVSNFYAGAGLGFGGVKTKDNREFHGIIPNVAIGFEVNRNSPIHSFVQLDVSQPVIAASQRGDLPKPFAELSLGAGF